jgi:hypothetical protein
MASEFLKPSNAGLRQPTDAQKENGQIINPPRYAEFGGLDKATRIKDVNPLAVVKPGRGASK